MMDKKEVMDKLRQAGEIYALVSVCTKMPFVVCDPETFDDEVMVFWTEDDAKAEGQKFLNEKHPLSIVRVENRQFLSFYSSLYTMGVNGILVDKGKEELHIQLNELVSRPGKNMEEGKVWVENPAFHLTALYLMQEVRRQKKTEASEELKDLQEEMLAHFREGKYIVSVQEDGGVPMLKQKDGDVFQPVFTDILEYRKFARNGKFKTAVVEYEMLASALPAEAKGVVVNPLGVNVPLQMERRKKETSV